MNENVSDSPAVADAGDLARIHAQMLRPGQNVNSDGSFELGWGVTLLFFGLGSYFTPLLPKAVWASPWTLWVGWLPLACAAFAPYAVPRLVKRFITWPRTGYVVGLGDVKLGQLVRLMVFGAALGLGGAMAVLLVPRVRDAMQHPAGPGEIRGIVWDAIMVLGCAATAVFLGRKSIGKRTMVPLGYDATVIRAEFGKTAAGRRQLRLARSVVVLMFVGVVVVIGGLVVVALWLARSLARPVEIPWGQVGVLGFVATCNGVLYLMGNAVDIKRHHWKWLVLPLLVLAPLGAARVLPYPAAPAGQMPILELFPPQAMLCLGLAWGVSGVATLLLFIRDHPTPAPEAP